MNFYIKEMLSSKVLNVDVLSHSWWEPCLVDCLVGPLPLGFDLLSTGWNSELHWHCETFPDVLYGRLLASAKVILEPLGLALARLDFWFRQNTMIEHTILIGVRGGGTVVLFQIGLVTQVVHRVITRLLLVHRYNTRSIEIKTSQNILFHLRFEVAEQLVLLGDIFLFLLVNVAASACLG